MPPKSAARARPISPLRPRQTARRGRIPTGPTTSISRLTAADSSTASIQQPSKKAQGKQRQSHPSPTDNEPGDSRADDSITSQTAAPWCIPERILLDRTLHLYSLSPMHFSGLPGSVRTVSPSAFGLLRAELYQYVNLRLSDGMGFLEEVNTISNARESTTGELVPPARRRRTDMGKVGRVRIDFLTDPALLEGFEGGVSASDDGKDEAKPWIIEMELGLPVARDGVGSSSSVATEAQSAELCHIVFLPGRSRSDAGLDSHSYPLILTKAPSAAVGGDQALGALSNVGRLVLTHALDWLQKRFDCRISHGSGAMSIASLLRGGPLEALAELVVRQTRIMSGTAEGRARSAKQKQVDAGVKPVELSFAFPATVACAGGRAGARVQGPAPELSSITLTVSWDVCMQLVEGLSHDQALLPALNHYLAAHTSIPLDELELVRIGVAGINLGVGLGSVRLKIGATPSAAAAAAGQVEGAKRKRGEARTASDEDKLRAGMVLGFLRGLADGRQ
ncbi:hypothetical protein ACQY0O_004378 [Thecaphora frezii]